MRYLLLLLLVGSAHASEYEKCGFVLGWARQAMYIATKIKLDEENWRITEDGFEPQEYAAIMRIKHEAYHDVPALTRRVELACGKKEES